MNSLVHSREALVPGGDLSTLITKLEAAATGSRELDALVWAWEQPEPVKVREAINADGYRSQIFFTLPPKRTEMVTRGIGPYRHADPVTTSLDAAVALAERVLPGWAWSVVRTDPCEAYVWPPEQAYADIQAKAVTPELALVIAILRAHASRAVEGE